MCAEGSILIASLTFVNISNGPIWKSHFLGLEKMSSQFKVTHQAQRHSRSLVCFEFGHRTDGRSWTRTPSSKIMTTYDRWAWWVNLKVVTRAWHAEDTGQGKNSISQFGYGCCEITRI